MKTWIKKALIASAAMLLVGLLFGLGIWGALQTDSGRNTLARYVSSAVSSDSFRLSLVGLHGRLPGEILLDRVSIADARGEWLVGEKLELDWSLWDLIRGRLRVNRILLEQLDFQRPPESEPKEASAPFKWDQLIFPDVVVDDLRLDRLQLADSFAPTPDPFQVTGRFISSGRTGAVRLNVRSLGDRPDLLNLEAAVRGAPLELTLDLDLQESPGGILGTVLGLPRPAALNVKLNGSGPLVDWQGRLAASADGAAALDSSWNLSLDQTLRFDVQGRLTVEEAILPTEAARYAGRAAQFRIQGQTDFANEMSLDRLHLETDPVRLDVNGRADLTGKTVQGTFTLEALDLSFLEETVGLSLQKGRIVTGAVSGPWAFPALELTSDLGLVGYQNLSAQKATVWLKVFPGEQADKEQAGFRAQGGLGLSGVKASENGFVPENLDLRFDLSTADLIHIAVEQVNITGGGVRIDASGLLNAETLALDSTVRIEAADLRHVPALREYGLSGRAMLDMAVAGILPDRDVKVDLRGQITDLNGLPAPVSAWVGRNPSWTVGSLIRGKVIDLSEIAFKGNAGLSGGGRLDLGRGEIDLKWGLKVSGASSPSASPIPGLAGAAVMNGTLTGPFQSMTATVEASADRLAWADLDFSKIAARLNATGIPDRIQGSLSLDLLGKGRPISLGTRYDVSLPEIRLRDLAVTAPGLTLTADGVFDSSRQMMDGQARLIVTDLTPLGDVFGQALSGSADLNLRAASTRGKQTADLNGTSSRLKVNELRIGEASVRLKTDDLTADPAGEAGLVAKNLQLGDLRLSRLDASLLGGLTGLRFKIDAAGSFLKPLKLTVGGTLDRRPEATRLTVQELDARYDAYPIRLTQPVALTQEPDVQRLDGLNLLIGEGRLTGSGLVTPQNVAVDLKADRLSLAALNMMSPVPVAGILNGGIRVAGDPVRPSLNADVRVSGFRPAASVSKEMPKADVTLAATVDRGRLTAEAEIRGLAKEPGQAELSVPMDFALRPFMVKIRPEERVDGRMRAAVDLRLVPALLYLDDQTISGLAEVGVTVKGTVAKPEVRGRVSIRGGRYENLRIGAILDQIDADIEAEEENLKLLSLKASDGEGGSISGSGGLGLNAADKFPYQAEFTLTRAQLVRLDFLRANTTGKLALSGRLDAAKIRGDLILDPVELTLPETLPPSMVDVEVVEINHPGTTGMSPPVKKATFDLKLDVGVYAPGRFFVRGRGLDSEWGGRLSVTGSADQPEVRGTFNVIRGRYSVLDRRFDLAQGSLTFDGSTPPIPLLNVIAETVLKDITAKIRITGVADAPKIGLESEPALPSDEILARLLFGRSLASISPFQAIRLAQAAAELSGVKSGSGMNIMGKAREYLGVDEIDIRQEQVGGTTVGLGKYVTENVYLRAESGLAAGAVGKVTVEVEISPHLSLETQVGSDSQSGLGLNWKTDY